MREDGGGHSACLDLLMQVHELDGYPPYVPEDVPRFITPDYEVAAWVAEREGSIVGHVALHQASADPTLDAAQRATGLPAEPIALSESEGWERVEALALRVDESAVLALWIYVSPETAEA